MRLETCRQEGTISTGNWRHAMNDILLFWGTYILILLAGLGLVAVTWN